MSGKIIIYIIITVLVIWSLDSININSIFKKNKVIQAKVFYFFLALSLIYLVTNFNFYLSVTTVFSGFSINDLLFIRKKQFGNNPLSYL